MLRLCHGVLDSPPQRPSEPFASGLLLSAFHHHVVRGHEDVINSLDMAMRYIFHGTVDVCDPLKLFKGIAHLAGLNNRLKGTILGAGTVDGGLKFGEGAMYSAVGQWKQDTENVGRYRSLVLEGIRSISFEILCRARGS